MDKSARPPLNDYLVNRLKERLLEDQYMSMIFVEEGEAQLLKQAIYDEAFGQQVKNQDKQ